MPATLTRDVRSPGPSMKQRPIRPHQALTADQRDLVASHLNTAYVTALHWAKRRARSVPTDDLIGEAFYALCYAGTKFKPEVGVPFGAYATMVIRHRLLVFTRWWQGRPAVPLDRGDTWAIAIVDPGADAAELANARQEVGRLRKHLDPNRFAILWGRLAEERPSQELADARGVTRQRICQIEAKATRQARRHLRGGLEV
jgi:RNA polymerase sigma factor (sigma-70 family)